MLFSQLFSEQFSQAMLPPSQSDVDGHNCVVPPPSLYTQLLHQLHTAKQVCRLIEYTMWEIQTFDQISANIGVHTSTYKGMLLAIKKCSVKLELHSNKMHLKLGGEQNKSVSNTYPQCLQQHHKGCSIV